MKRKRVIGTTIEAINSEELKLGKKLPPSFSTWLIEHNGTNVEGIHIYPVLDPRDKRMTWESLSHNIANGWAAWLENFEDDDLSFEHLLPFANFGTGDYYCFDYANDGCGDEKVVVLWSHETGETSFRANNFEEFSVLVRSREFEYD